MRTLCPCSNSHAFFIRSVPSPLSSTSPIHIMHQSIVSLQGWGRWLSSAGLMWGEPTKMLPQGGRDIIQICHASVDILMECLPEGGWLPSRGWQAIWHICFIISNKPQFGKISMKTTMTAGRSAGATWKRASALNVKVTDDWWFTHSPLGVTSDNCGHYANQWTWWLPTAKSANHGLWSSSEVW